MTKIYEKQCKNQGIDYDTVTHIKRGELMTLDDLKIEYDKLQLKYGAKELDSIYNGGCTDNPDICFVFMNPTGRNIASDKSWKGLKSP